MIRNGLYKITTEMLDGVGITNVHIIILHNGKLHGGGPYFYTVGSYGCSGGKWKGEATTQEHTPFPGVHPWARKVVTLGFSSRRQRLRFETTIPSASRGRAQPVFCFWADYFSLGSHTNSRSADTLGISIEPYLRGTKSFFSRLRSAALTVPRPSWVKEPKSDCDALTVFCPSDDPSRRLPMLRRRARSDRFASVRRSRPSRSGNCARAARQNIAIRLDHVGSCAASRPAAAATLCSRQDPRPS